MVKGQISLTEKKKWKSKETFEPLRAAGALFGSKNGTSGTNVLFIDLSNVGQIDSRDR